ncbi:spore cortex biosynthesis protein YabQ [Bacillus horti]|uniref:Spore cortex biosynthesis protein YabQ n=1 Tax=Caldalkalibacillus horti TaxID=77523 RepID=A0ABT9W2X2_9BACI|nr:spore cortex biosynthesis protein YabQ [Bacillus horti]MDQ0167591.1 spore cortex biosynthesis protein YabQ [Bacillus horti]
MTLSIQALTMLHMIGAGLFLGISYDTYARLRLKKKSWLILTQDLLFWMINGMIVFLWLQFVNTGQMRVYIFLSLICGYAAYQALFGGFYRKGLEGILQLLHWSYKTLRQIVRIFLIIPIVWLYKIISIVILFILGAVASIFKFLYKIMAFLLRPFGVWGKALWHRWRPNSSKSPPTDDPEQKNRTLGGEGFLKNIANWLYKSKK